MGEAGFPVVPGPVLFARYAFPPNSHGFCGPADSGGLFEYGVAGRDDGGLRARFSTLTEGVLAGGVPHHSFAVFCIYPYTGLLTDGRKAPHALTVLDRCRIRWGRVLAVEGDQAVVESRPLTWDGDRLQLGPVGTETVVRSVDGVGMVGTVAPGDWVSMHWEWICDRLSDAQVSRLRHYTERHLAIVNDRSARSAVPALLG
jgi:hypothetical protein